MRYCLVLLGILCLTHMASADSLPYRTLAAIPAQPLTPQVMQQTRGKATPALMQFLQQATQTQLGGGVVVYTLCPDGCTVSAMWQTGSASGMGTVVK